MSASEKEKLLTADEARKLLSYDAETGKFMWTGKTGKGTRIGKEAGCVGGEGYIVIKINRRGYLAHRLAWLITFGHWPEQFIDHINCQRADNRLCNLRDVSANINAQNTKTASRHSKSGLLGVYRMESRKKWAATIRIGGRVKWLGLFTKAEDAHAAYLAAKRQHHEGNTL